MQVAGFGPLKIREKDTDALIIVNFDHFGHVRLRGDYLDTDIDEVFGSVTLCAVEGQEVVIFVDVEEYVRIVAWFDMAGTVQLPGAN